MPNQPAITPTVHPMARRHSLVRHTFPSLPANNTMIPSKIVTPTKPVKTAKAKIPKALREQVWRNWVGEKYDAKCLVTWCTNKITVFDFEVGHNIPESKGGTLHADNLRPICSRCNKSMGNHYTIDQWNTIQGNPVAVEQVTTQSTWCCFPLL